MKANFVYETVFQPKPEEDVKHILSSMDKERKQRLFNNAVERGNIGLMKILLKSGDIDLEYRSYHDATYLMEATYYGRLKVVKILHDAGADVNARDKKGKTPLMYTPGKGELLASTSLSATIRQRYKIVSLLINARADINAQDNFGRTALMNWLIEVDTSILVPRKGTYQYLLLIIDLLVDAGADINIKDYFVGDTALTVASYKHNKLIYNHLLSKLKEQN